MCDELQLQCRLVRGDYESGRGSGGHAWNVVRCGQRWWLCDVMHRPGTLYPIDSEKAEHYKRLDFAAIDAHGGGVGADSIPISPVMEVQERDPNFIPRKELEIKGRLGAGGFGVVHRAVWNEYVSSVDDVLIETCIFYVSHRRTYTVTD